MTPTKPNPFLPVDTPNAQKHTHNFFLPVTLCFYFGRVFYDGVFSSMILKNSTALHTLYREGTKGTVI